MPELPEVEVIKRGLSPHIIDRHIRAVKWSNRKLRLPMPRARLQQWVNGAQINDVCRRGKYLLIHLKNNGCLIVHLGMTGKILLLDRMNARHKHDHLTLLLDNNFEIRFNDTRRFGSIQVTAPDESLADFFIKLGPEPFSDKFSALWLHSKACKRTCPVKNFLMDNHVVVGIGNIYASEILYCASILPTTSASAVSLKKWRQVVQCSRKILARAIKAGGSSIVDFVGSDGESGYFQLELQVYGRNGGPCGKCNSAIQRSVLAGRATYFCPECQRAP